MIVTALRVIGCALCISLSISMAGCSKQYGGKSTLENYPNVKTTESELAKDTLLRLIGFWDEDKNLQVVSPEQQVEITAFLYLGLHTGWVHDVDVRSMDIRPTGPYIAKIGQYDNTHQRARVYYSNDVVDWLRNGRRGEIPDGSMIVKQMYPSDPKNTSYGGSKVTGWAVMIRDSKATKDGWLWYLFFFPGTPSYKKPVLLASYGMSYCLTCHSGADNNQSTYSFIGNLEGKEVNQYETYDPMDLEYLTAAPLGGHGGQPSMFSLHMDDKDTSNVIDDTHEHRASRHESLIKDVATHLGDIPGELEKLFADYVQESMSPPVSQRLSQPNPAILETFDRRQVDAGKLPRLPWDMVADHTVADPDDLKSFITSSNCRGCHDASLLLGPRRPAMLVKAHEDWNDPDSKRVNYNISIFGEWSSSMMGLAGRDPIFLAQLESEQALRPDIKDYTSNLCLSCHQVAGQRQFHIDNGDSVYFTADDMYVPPTGKHRNASAEYGSLGRDGVTCTVCHQIMPDGLGEPDTFTGRFKTNPEPGTMFGPYATEDVKPYYMQQALGIEPKYGEQIKDAGLCGSCHTVKLPVLPRGASSPPADDAPTIHEQTTYLEWLNSNYSDPDNGETCQDCHMPGNFLDEEELTAVLANVEDKYFPKVANRAADDLITPLPKKGYRRHTLVGLNIFANRMFQQFPMDLGVTTIDPGTPDQFGQTPGSTVHRLRLTEMEMEAMAARTVSLAARITEKNDENWLLEVDLENLTGHKFPSGVGFRRAFLQVNAISHDGDVLWSSGSTNAAGVILGSDGKPLASEFTMDWRELQPDYTTITSEDQVQIFETRHINDEQQLTTSFLGLAREVKDNRLLPTGWSPDGQYADATQLHQLGGEPLPVATPGSRSFEYRIPSHAGKLSKVEVKLLYQAIPPYYLRDRFETTGPETDRLYYLTSYLDLSDSLAKDWSVRVAYTETR
ncbi:MAG: cytochrome P460 family protein [Xanthomonadales bacterium]|nr:cytochrome P460 family protein [Xanthomonadales bacterium]